MSTQKKLPNGTMAANRAKRPQPDRFKVSDIVNSRIRELIPAESQSVFCRFQGNLRTYLSLQSRAVRERKKISNLISFTSTHIGPDALAVPASTYVRDTWGRDGTTILRMVDDAIRTDQVRKVEGTLSNGCNVSIAVHENHLDLIIKGPQNLFSKIVEQLCWLVCVAGHKPITYLRKYIKQTNQGTTTRSEVETIYTERPIINSKDGYHVQVSFTEASVEDAPKGSLSATPGHCWKTMTGLTIVARGFAIPPRPRQGSGLEASLAVLRQLFRRGFPSTHPVAMDKPMALFPPQATKRVERAGKAADVYELRLIMAADCERPLRAKRNVIYWHFDPARICASENSIQELEDSITVEPWAVDPQSRHFVGWSTAAGLLAMSTKPIPLGGFCSLRHRGYFEFVLTSIAVNLRLPGLLSLGFNVAAEKVETSAIKDKMPDRDTQLQQIRGRNFVIWDVDRKRGWLLRGDVVALHVLRLYLGQAATTEEFDFSSLKILKDVENDASPAYKVLSWLNDEKSALKQIFKGHSDTEDDAEKKLKEALGPKLDTIYAQLLHMSDGSPRLNQHGASISGPLRTWFKKKWSTTLRGWDLKALASLDEAHPLPGSSCCHFPTLPAGKNFLASNMETLGRLVEKYGGDDKMGDPPDTTVARLSRCHGWEKGLDPFERKYCKGDHDHLSTLGTSCFPHEVGELGRFEGYWRLSDPEHIFATT
ncbi:hypothetical protein KVR01_011922 [Diaporthe batatas]|uniref:uncharacterized protein n=1 Tax=Diaporthe batatas TaxID=748121 RepID=UPI001D0507F4|nr:uncharacterized protein KVR01_011922 [Diaporthe batatas]KAG8158161.1 hypothetical protein KVR01_011922 [Diaporthe batatas]